MKIIQYCQYVLGIGHFYRTLEICRALSDHEVLLVTGGSGINASLPDHIAEFQLPGLVMDREFKSLFSKNEEYSIDQIKRKRRQMLFSLYKKEAPDLFMVELYPFGRRAFAFEIDPILKGIYYNLLKPARVVCSLRDILVDRRKYQAFYESKVVDVLNRYFDALLVHSDPLILKIDETFSRIRDITIPVVYTGFVTPKPEPKARENLRNQLNIGEDEILVLASLGGGRVGRSLIEAVIHAFNQINTNRYGRLIVFAGPSMDRKGFDDLKLHANKKVQVRRFTSDFLSYLAAADLSVSMAGYNTCMNILAARVPALVWPFSQNREQIFRAERLADIGTLRVLHDEDLKPSRLAGIMEQAMSKPFNSIIDIDLDGAANTARWLQNWVNSKKEII
jgi:predicted glycosyltransferase